jgi:hypothetical protein
VDSLKICWIHDHESNPQTESFQNSNDSNSGIGIDQDLFCKARYKSMGSQYKSMDAQFPDTNPTTLKKLEVNFILKTQSYEKIKQQYLLFSRLAEQFSMSSDFIAICHANLAAAYLKKQVIFKLVTAATT